MDTREKLRNVLFDIAGKRQGLVFKGAKLQFSIKLKLKEMCRL
jgi:hypothetical protein